MATRQTKAADSIEQGKSLKLIKMPQVKEKTSLGTTTIYDRIAKGCFPKPISIGGNRVAWVESEIDAFIEAQIKQSREGRS